MLYTEGEIANSYRLAKEPKKQIKILAQLNSVTEDVIRDILEKYGYDTKKKRSTRSTWTAEEEREIAKRSIAGQKNTEIAKALNRTAGAVTWKMQELIQNGIFFEVQKEMREKGITHEIRRKSAEEKRRVASRNA